MATEYVFSYSASEIERKLAAVDEIESQLQNDYYTSAEVDVKLKAKADLVDGKIPVEQLPDDIGGNNLTFDTEPTEGSSNLINSGSLYNIIGNVNLVIDSINALIGGEIE